MRTTDGTPIEIVGCSSLAIAPRAACATRSGTLTTGTLVEYTLPSAGDLPAFTTDRTETPATSNDLGVKGVGEAGTIASTPAVVNAIVDALRPWGVDDIEMPCTPQRVWRAVQGSGGAQ